MRAVVADHADPVAVRLLSERIELAPQQLGRRIEGRHADRDPRPGRIGREPRSRRLRRRQRRGELDRPHDGLPCPQTRNLGAQDDLRATGRRRGGHDGNPCESAAVRVPSGVALPLPDVAARQGVVCERGTSTSHFDLQRRRAAGRMVAPTGQREGGSPSDGDLSRRTDVESGPQMVRRRAHEPPVSPDGSPPEASAKPTPRSSSCLCGAAKPVDVTVEATLLSSPDRTDVPAQAR